MENSLLSELKDNLAGITLLGEYCGFIFLLFQKVIHFRSLILSACYKI